MPKLTCKSLHNITGRTCAALCLSALLTLFSQGVQANAARLALVMGNSNYPDSPLANPQNDAVDMASALEELDFEVILVMDADRRSMARSIRTFGNKLKQQKGIGLFYYAGHGVQLDNRNFLIPVDTPITDEDEIPYESVDVGSVLAKMQSAGNALNIMILDACRNNPFPSAFRSASRGLARVDAPVGSLVVYSTAPGKVAADGNGRNGVFTGHLLNFLQEPGLSLTQTIRKTRAAVVRETSGKQVPWESNSLLQEYYLHPDSEQATLTPTSLPIAAISSNEHYATHTFVEIPGGSFKMGCSTGDKSCSKTEQPQRDVRVRDFRISSKEITVNQFQAFVEATGYVSDAERNSGGFKGCYVWQEKGGISRSNSGWLWRADAYWQNPGFAQQTNFPVSCISWHDATAYTTWLSEVSNRRIRLPSEAEWELAARAGNHTRYPEGVSASSLCGIANGADRGASPKGSTWTDRLSCTDGHWFNAPVGSYQPNSLGLYDMQGNVQEWVADVWSANLVSIPLTGEANTVGSDSERVLRGGAWDSASRKLRLSSRNRAVSHARASMTGFRVVEDLDY